MPLGYRVLQFHQVADDELIQVNDLLTQFRQPVVLLMPAIPTAPHEARAADDADPELILAACGTGSPRRRDEIARIAPFLRHKSILLKLLIPFPLLRSPQLDSDPACNA